jgi:hypothetical protein
VEEIKRGSITVREAETKVAQGFRVMVATEIIDFVDSSSSVCKT